MKKRWAWRFNLLFFIGLLAGCSQKELPTEPQGRFVEETLDVPLELQTGHYLDSFEYNNKLVTLSYSKQEDQYYVYNYDGETWESENIDLGHVADKITISGIAECIDSKRYVYGYDENKEYHILSANPNDPPLLSDALRGISSKDQDARVDKVIMQDDGNILVSLADKAVLFSKEEEILYEFIQDYSPGNPRKSAFLSDTAYVTILNQKPVRYSLKDGELQELNNEQTFNLQSCIFSNKKGSVYIANKNGLYHLYENSTTVEKVIDGTSNSMSLQSDSIRMFYMNGENTYYSVMRSLNGNVSFFKYTYRSDIPTLPPNTLTVYSLEDSPSLRQAAVLMQRENPDVRVEVRIAMGNGNESLSNDIIRSLNAELLNGDGADVLVLNGLPKDVYKEKGILMNLKDLYGEIQQTASFLPNIARNYVNSQGDIYYLPARLHMPVAFGEKNALEALSSMAFSEIPDAAVPILATDTYGNLERLILNMCYQQVFSNGNTELSESHLKIFLKNVKKLGEKANAKVEFTPHEMESLMVDNFVSDHGNRSNTPIAFAEEKTPVGFEIIGSMQDSILMFGALENKGLEPESLDGLFYPNLIMGINTHTKQPEFAKKYLKILYSADIQNQSLGDGFGVLETAVQAWKDVERETTLIIGDLDNPTISASWPAKEKRNQIIEIINSLTTPADIDPVIMGIISEYSRGYYEGDQELDATVDLIMNKVGLYEQE